MADLAHLKMESNGNGNGSAADLPFGAATAALKESVRVILSNKRLFECKSIVSGQNR